MERFVSRFPVNSFRPVASGACLLPLLLLFTTPARADTIFQRTPQRTERIHHRNAIVVQEDSSSILYKHFDLKERRVVKVRLLKGSLPYRVEKSDPDKRERIVATWRQFGFTAQVTDKTGKTSKVSALFLDFYPPGGRGSLFAPIPPRTALPVLLPGGRVLEIEFADIDRVEFHAHRMQVHLAEGQVVECEFRTPSKEPAEARLLGITGNYSPESKEVFDFSIRVDNIQSVKFPDGRRRRRFP